MIKHCNRCRRDLPLNSFYKAASKKSANNPGYKSHCKECILATMKASYNTPEGYKRKIEKCWRDKGININLEQYNQLLEKQGGVCAICSADKNKNGTALCVDHCHASGVVRGLLCHNCNVTLGRFSESAEALLKAANYLQQWKNAA